VADLGTYSMSKMQQGMKTKIPTSRRVLSRRLRGPKVGVADYPRHHPLPFHPS
jgi:hypothetical protein